MPKDFFIYNTLSKHIDKLVTIKPGRVGIYACGPTVYDYAHIGHLRTYVNNDVLRRTLEWLGYNVYQVMNITDVGHLVTDADSGDDKVEKKARKEGLTAWQIAEKYTHHFWSSLDAVNIKRPNKVAKATDHIKEMIGLVKELEDNGYTYTIENDGIYFDTSKLKDYGKLATIDLKQLKAGARVEMVAGKRQPTDFALWKFSPKDKKRQMEWDSPWGVGFPGWHIECSAMSMKYLGPTFDIHTGGVDHINVHHTNEIAQSESATGQPFAHYWIHFEHVLVEGQKMSKSKGNFYRLEDIVSKGYHPLALRYLFLTSHYRQTLDFSWQSLAAAAKAYRHLIEELVLFYYLATGQAKLDVKLKDEAVGYFSHDLKMPEAISFLWRIVKSEKLAPEVKLGTVFDLDEVLGLKLEAQIKQALAVPKEIQQLAQKRWLLKKEGKYDRADSLRLKVKARGYIIKDQNANYLVFKKLD